MTFAFYPRAVGRRARIVDEKHWDGLPTGAGRHVITSEALSAPPKPAVRPGHGPLQAHPNRSAAAGVEFGPRSLSVYEELTGTPTFPSPA